MILTPSVFLFSAEVHLFSVRRFLNEQTISSEQLILKDHKGTVSIEGRTITNLHFADDVDGLAGEEETLANLVERLNKASTAYGMETSAQKTKLTTSNTSGINTEIKVNGPKLEGSKPEILSRIAQRTAALTRLKPVWNDRSISLSSKI